MPYSIPEQAIIELTFVGELYLQKTMTVLHYVVTTAPPANDAWNQLTTLCDDIQASLLWTQYLACIATNWQSREIRAQVVANNRRPVVVKPVLNNGTMAGTARTVNISGVITKRTDVITHRKVPTKMGGVGAIHIPAISNDELDSGKLTLLQQNTMADLVPKILLTFGLGGTGVISPCLWHRQTGAPILYDLLQACEVQDTIRTMRRRTLALGI